MLMRARHSIRAIALNFPLHSFTGYSAVLEGGTSEEHGSVGLQPGRARRHRSLTKHKASQDTGLANAAGSLRRGVQEIGHRPEHSSM